MSVLAQKRTISQDRSFIELDMQRSDEVYHTEPPHASDTHGYLERNLWRECGMQDEEVVERNRQRRHTDDSGLQHSGSARKDIAQHRSKTLGHDGSTGTSSAQISTRRTFATTESERIWAVVVGVDAYRDPNTPNLSGACADAKAMRNHLIRDLKVPPAHITFLLSEDRIASEESTLQSSDTSGETADQSAAGTSISSASGISYNVFSEPVRTEPPSVTQQHNGAPGKLYSHWPVLPATREHMLNAYYDVRDNPRIRHNDTIILYFAGHGARWDFNTAEEHIEEHIETLCPADRGCLDGEGKTIPDITDREFSIILDELHAAKGDHIIVIADCCHSGGVTRDALGGDVRIRCSPRISSMTADDLLKTASHPRKRSHKDPAAENWDWDPACCVLLAACLPSEVANEIHLSGQVQGFFTYSLLHVLRYNSPTNLSDLRRMISDHMPKFRSRCLQNPVLLGPDDRISGQEFLPWLSRGPNGEISDDSHEIRRPVSYTGSPKDVERRNKR